MKKKKKQTYNLYTERGLLGQATPNLWSETVLMYTAMVQYVVKLCV